MTPKLKKYLRDNLWKEFEGYWDKTRNEHCYSTIKEDSGVFVYSEDCPDIRMDYYPPDIFFISEEKLIAFLEKII